MTRHIIRRIIQAIPTLFGVTLLSYLLMTAAPGGPLSFFAFSDPQNMTDAQVERMEAEFGLNSPWYIQYVRWLTGNLIFPVDAARNNDGEETTSSVATSGSAVTGCSISAAEREGILFGDFGCSYRLRRPVADVILEKIPATIELGIASLLVGLVIGVPVGILAAIQRGGIFDNTTRIFAVIGNSVPNFWMGLILLLIFAFTLQNADGSGLLPSGGRCPRTREGCGVIPIYERLQYMILPVIVLSLGGIAGWSRYMRTSMLETINSDYVRTARAKGLNARVVWMRHAARNALIPLATFLGPAVVFTLSGAVITEQIFSWPGLGRTLIEAVGAQDYPVIMATTVLSAVLTVIAFILSDILYAIFDPRIRF
jgi:peptide/nickel transport system permease protein